MSIVTPDTFQRYRILSIDPGLNNTGCSIYEIEHSQSGILNIQSFTLQNDKLKNNIPLDLEFYPERMVKLYKLKQALTEVIMHYQPALVVCESPFYNRFRPMAYGALLEVLSIIQSSLLSFNINIPFYTVEPLLIKKTVGAGMMKGKLDVKEAVRRIPSIMNVLQNSLDDLDEHAIDSIAVGYTFLKVRGGFNHV